MLMGRVPDYPLKYAALLEAAVVVREVEFVEMLLIDQLACLVRIYFTVLTVSRNIPFTSLIDVAVP